MFLNESVTFHVQKYSDAPTDILSLCFKLKYAIYNVIKSKYSVLFRTIEKRFNGGSNLLRVEPDGDDFDRTVGTVNVYLNIKNKVEFDVMKESIIDALAKFPNVKGQISSIETQFDENHKRKPFSGTDFKTVGVIRVKVTIDREGEEDLPEMTLANANASAFLQAIGIDDPDDELSGSIQLKDIPKMLQHLKMLQKNNDFSKYTRDSHTEYRTSVSKKDGIDTISRTPSVVSLGLPEYRIRSYVSSLIDILEKALELGVGVSYA